MQDEHPQTCGKGHAIPCGREAQARWRIKRRAQTQLLRALKARGIAVTVDGRLEVADEQLLAMSIR